MSHIKNYKEFLNEAVSEKKLADNEKKALDILKSLKGGYDSNKSYLRKIIKDINAIKSNVSKETKQKLIKQITTIKDVIKEL